MNRKDIHRIRQRARTMHSAMRRLQVATRELESTMVGQFHCETPNAARRALERAMGHTRDFNQLISAAAGIEMRLAATVTGAMDEQARALEDFEAAHEVTGKAPSSATKLATTSQMWGVVKRLTVKVECNRITPIEMNSLPGCHQYKIKGKNELDRTGPCAASFIRNVRNEFTKKGYATIAPQHDATGWHLIVNVNPFATTDDFLKEVADTCIKVRPALCPGIATVRKFVKDNEWWNVDVRSWKAPKKVFTGDYAGCSAVRVKSTRAWMTQAAVKVAQARMKTLIDAGFKGVVLRRSPKDGVCLLIPTWPKTPPRK